MHSHENRTDVVIFTYHYVVHGWISLVPGARLTDFVREAESFIPVLDCVVFDHDEKELFRADFLDVARDAIEMAVPSKLHTSSIIPPPIEMDDED